MIKIRVRSYEKGRWYLRSVSASQFFKCLYSAIIDFILSHLWICKHQVEHIQVDSLQRIKDTSWQYLIVSERVPLDNGDKLVSGEVLHDVQLLQCGPLSPNLVDYSFHKSLSGLLPIFWFLTNFEYGGVLPSFCLTRKEWVYMICCNLPAIVASCLWQKKDVCIPSRTVVLGMGSCTINVGFFLLLCAVF